MSFIKEYIPKKDEELFNLWKMYNYDKENIRKWNPYDKWLADRERKIYFMHIGGSGNLEQAPQQYNLIWDNKKIVIFIDNYSGIHDWNILKIYAPNELKLVETELITLIKTVIEENHKVDIYKGGYIYCATKMTINNLHNIYYQDNVW